MRSRTTSRVDRTALPLVCFCGLLVFSVAAAPPETNVIASHAVKSDFALSADPDAPAWKGIAGVFAEKDRRGLVIPSHRTEIRSRWTAKNLYLLYISPYEELHLKADPTTRAATNKLWEWDVAEAFIGSDFQDIKKYKEFQVSPQGEWVDLAIDRGTTPPTHDVTWRSGFEVKARLDRDKRIWYGEMRIPMATIDTRAAKPGLEMRINLYRCQGLPPDRKYINWQPVMSDNFHTPEAFGRLRLQD